MIKDFKFLRNDDDIIVSQTQWNRRRDALMERINLEEERRQIEQERVVREVELNQIFDSVLKDLEETNEKVSLRTKIINRMNSSFYTVPILVFGGMFVGYWILRLVSALIKY
jgi:hypothetical protein